MGAPQNRLKFDLKQDRASFGLWLALRSGDIAEMAAGAGFDWCLIDAEHGPNADADILRQLQAMSGHDAPPVVRLPAGEDWMIKRVLDLGVQNLMIPMVETAVQAHALVRATRYPPDGIRGVGAGLTRASRYNTTPDYLATATAEICLIAQIESAAAVGQIPGIAAVDGVDVLFIGPSDLAADMGFLGQPEAPEVEQKIREALTAIRSAGKVAGIYAPNVAMAERYAGWGARFIGIGSDVTVLSAALGELAQEAGDRLR